MEAVPNTYRRVRVDPSVEVKAVSVLMRSGQSFTAVSKTDYFISRKQCELLNDSDIPYTKL